MELAINISNGVFCRRHGFQTSDDAIIWILELFRGTGGKDMRGVPRLRRVNREMFTYDNISAVGRTGAPSVLTTVRAIEGPPSLREIVIPGQYEKIASERRGFQNARGFEGPVAQGRSLGLHSVNDGDLTSGSRRKRYDTFPMVACPRPPLAAHSNLATRSSLLGRMARQREVTL